MKEPKPRLTDEEKRAKRRAEYRLKADAELSRVYLAKLVDGKNAILREDYGSFVRWTWADRTGEWLKAGACEKLIAAKEVRLLRSDGSTQVFGDRA